MRGIAGLWCHCVAIAIELHCCCHYEAKRLLASKILNTDSCWSIVVPICTTHDTGQYIYNIYSTNLIPISIPVHRTRYKCYRPVFYTLLASTLQEVLCRKVSKDVNKLWVRCKARDFVWTIRGSDMLYTRDMRGINTLCRPNARRDASNEKMCRQMSQRSLHTFIKLCYANVWPYELNKTCLDQLILLSWLTN